MLKKLMTIILVVELGLLYLPEKYIFASEDDPQAETEETTSEESTIPTIPEMSGIEDTTTPTEIEPVTDMITEDAPVEEATPVEETAPVEPVSQPAESTNTITPQNDLTTEDKWFVFNGTTNTITGYSSSTSAPKNINIPSTIGGIPVYNIGDSAFTGQQLTGLILPNGLKTIGNNAFENNRNMAGDLVIPDSVTSIGKWAFHYCSGLASVTIGDSVTSIGDWAFYECYNLTYIDIPSKNEGEISGLPWGATNAILFWKGVKQIGDYAFNTITNTIVKYNGVETTVNIPSTFTADGISYPVQKIGNKAFKDNKTITNITIPDSVTNIDSDVFSYGKVRIIDIPGKNKDEISGAPWGAGNATVFWKNVKQVDDYIFNTTSGTITRYTGSATTLTIPSTLNVDGTSYSVKMIGDSAFAYSVFTSVIIPDSVINIGRSAFSECRDLTNVKIGNSVTSIGDLSFNGCYFINSIEIPDSVTSIGANTFVDCFSLESIYIPGKNEGEIKWAPWSADDTTIVYWKDVKQIGDYLFNTTSGTILKYTGAATLLNIPSTLTVNGISYPVKKIGVNAFKDCRFTNVTIPDSVTIIGASAFNSCRRLTNITIGNSVTSIEEYAFRFCSNLTYITLPDSITSIYYSAFDNCNAITRIDIPGKNEGEIKGAPWSAPSNTKVYWKDTKQVGDYLFSTTKGSIYKYLGTSRTLNIPSTFTVDGISYPVKKISASAFEDNNTVTNVTIPDSVTSIGKSAFYGCSCLTSITIGNSVTSIGGGAFYGCKALTRIDISGKNEGEIKGEPWSAPNTTVVCWKDVKQIGEFLFSITSGTIKQYLGIDPVVTIPSYFTVDDTDYPVKMIGDTAFSSNKTITTVTIPDSVESIGLQSFYGCDLLKSISIGNGVTSIGNTAFQSCGNLISVTIPDSVTSIGFRAFSYCSSLTQIVISKNLNFIEGDSLFDYSDALQTIYMRGSRTGLPTSITNTQPWGAPASSTVWYAGDIVTFDHTVKKVTGQYNRVIDIRAFVNKPALINRIILPNGTIKFVGKSDWPDETGYYSYGSIPEEAITANGTYVFKGYGDDNVEQSYSVEINDIGIITLRANEASITEQVAATASEQDVLDLLNVSAEDEAGVLTNGTDCTFWISPEDMNKIHALHLGDVTTIRVNVKSSRSGQEMTSYRDVTLNTTSCVIHADNVDLWPPQITNLTKVQLLDLMHVSVVDSEGVADMTKLVMSDEDFNKIKTGTPGIYNVLLTYATNKAKKRVRVTIMDDSPSVMVKIPSEIKMKTIDHDSVYGVGAEETVSIQSFVNTTLYPNPFKIETDPSFWLKSTATDATGFNRMKVIVLNANDQPLPDNHLLATLSGSTIQSAPFKLRGYHNQWNSKGAYSGIMTFTITYEELAP